MKFSIGYNEKEWFLDLLEDRKDQISSVYFPLPKELGSSWRPARQQHAYREQVDALVEKCGSSGIDTILLLNATHDREGAFSKESLSRLFQYMERLIDAGLTSVTITNMLYVKLIRRRFPNLVIYSSVNARLKEVEQAVFFRDLGVDILTVDRDINRDLALIERMKKSTWLRIQLMLNEPCLRNCPFRHAHFEAVSDNNEQVFWIEFEDLTCYPLIRENPKLFFRIPFVRPDDLRHYKDFVDVYKLVTRDASNEKIGFLLDAYSAEKYEGNVVDLFDIEPQQYLAQLRIDNKILNEKGFFSKIRKCPGNCGVCSMCDEYFLP